MTEVYRRKLALNKCTPTLTAVTLFYSRIILKKLTAENKTTFRKLEKSVKFSVNIVNCTIITRYARLTHFPEIFRYNKCSNLVVVWLTSD